MTPDSSKVLLARLLLAVGVVGAASGCGARSEPPFDETGGPVDVTSTGQSGAAGSSNKAGAGGTSQGGSSQGGSSQGGSSQGGTSQGGSAGATGMAVCKNPDSPPKDSNGQNKCENNGALAICDLRCYAPGPSTFPAPCLAASDPSLLKLPNFELQTCGLKKVDSGPYCNAEMEKYGGNTPICCYVTVVEPCAGRPLYVASQPRLARLVRVAFG